jgi:hypothetical protein
MRRSSSLKARVRQVEEARGAGHVSLTFSDNSKRSFCLQRNNCLEILLASFDLARASRDPNARPSSTPGAIELARLIGKADQVTPHSQLWDTVAAIVREAEEEERCTRLCIG